MTLEIAAGDQDGCSSFAKLDCPAQILFRWLLQDAVLMLHPYTWQWLYQDICPDTFLSPNVLFVFFVCELSGCDRRLLWAQDPLPLTHLSSLTSCKSYWDVSYYCLAHYSTHLSLWNNDPILIRPFLSSLFFLSCWCVLYYTFYQLRSWVVLWPKAIIIKYSG